MEIYPTANQSQEEQARSPRRRNSGVPGFAGGQREAILKMLRAPGAAGVSKEELLFEKHYSQAVARIWELEQQGFRIAHVQREGEKYVRYILESEPQKVNPLPSYRPIGPDPRQSTLADSPDWFERQTGQPRSAPTPEFGLEP